MADDLTNPPDGGRETFARWKAELDFAQKDSAYVSWLTRSEKIIKRYRDERDDEISKTKRRFNVLWSNVQTLKPAVYGAMPKPIVERRYMDRDPAARMASTILERTASFQMEVGYFDQSVSKAVDDYLLPGMGQVWVRYEPQFETEEEAYENADIQRQERDGPEPTAQEIEDNGDGEPYQKLAYEKVCADYVYYRDFLWGPARCWGEVPWVGRRSWLTRSEIAEKFFDDDLEKAQQITLDYTPDRMRNATGEEERAAGFVKKAEIWEIWNKADRTVYFIAPATPGVVLRKEENPLLKLEGFWPCPPPLFATLTNDTLIPVPDYAEYQDQATELDDLTNRISMITQAVRANGVYDSSVPSLARLMQEGTDNKLIAVDQWAAFAEKGGMAGAVSLLPMKEIIEVLLRLYEARAQVKNDLYEITGISDIVRGQSAAGAKTATEQRIKGQYASLRLNERQKKVGEFCRSVLRIMVEIIAEQFTPESLLQMSGVDQMMRDEVRKAAEKVPKPQPQPGMPPEIAQQQYAAAQQQAMQAEMQKQQGLFQQAMEILRSDKLRGFRIDIETDTTLQGDAEADKQAAIELFASTTQGINQIAPIAQMAPELVDPLGDMLLFTYRRFRVGRSMESSLEDALTKLKERLEESAQNPPPNPEQMKAQAEIQKQQMVSQQLQEKHQMEMQAKQADFEIEKQKNAMEIAKMQAELQIERERLQIEREKLGIEAAAAAQKAQIQSEQTGMKLEAQREQRTMDREAADHQHALGMQTMEAKAQAAQQQAKAKPNGAAK